MSAFPCKTMLLIGPTGSGKTPLGEALAERGINGHRAVHFDFGSHLRLAVNDPADYPLLTPEDITLLQQKLLDNALLDDNEFYIAERILGSRISGNNLGPEDYLILNGIPRHTGQAQALVSIVTIATVIYLECEAEVVHHRIDRNTGGDRTSRSDDTATEIERKLTIFRERTVPLLAYYRQQNVPLLTITVEPDMSGDDLFAKTGFSR